MAYSEIERLHAALAAVCPIAGVSVPTSGSGVGVQVSYSPSATGPQITAAQAALAAFDWSGASQTTWQTQQNRLQGKADMLSSTGSVYKLLRCMLEVLRQSLNAIEDVIGSGTLVFDPQSIANAAGTTSANITVAGAAFGDFVDVAAPYTLAGITCNGYVSAANTVNIRLHNGTGAAVNLASGTWKVLVRRQPGVRTYTQMRTAIEAMIDAGTLD